MPLLLKDTKIVSRKSHQCPWGSESEKESEEQQGETTGQHGGVTMPNAGGANETAQEKGDEEDAEGGTEVPHEVGKEYDSKTGPSIICGGGTEDMEVYRAPSVAEGKECRVHPAGVGTEGAVTCVSHLEHGTLPHPELHHHR